MEQEMVQVFATSKWIFLFTSFYCVVIIGVGFYYSNRVNEDEDLVLASRSMTLPFLISSVVATWIGAGVVMGAATEAFTFGFQGIIFDPIAPMLTLIILGLFIAHKIRKAKYTTVVDFYISRYSKRLSGIFVVLQLLSGMAWQAGQLVALGVIISLTIGVPADTATIIGAGVVIMVTWFGGLHALSRLDMLALVLILTGLVVMLPYAFGHEAVGGISGFLQNASNWSELPAFSVGYSNALDAAGDTYGYMWYTGILGVTYLIAAWSCVTMGDLSCTTLTLRALAAKDEKTASRGFVIGGAVYLAIGMIPVILGMCVYMINPDFPILQADYLLPWFADSFIPGWAAVLFIVSLAAAIMSTTGDNLLGDATIIGHNFAKFYKPDMSPKQVLIIIRLVIPFVALAALAIGLYFQSIYKLVVFAGALLFPTMTASYLGGLFWKKGNSIGAFCSFISGVVSWSLGCFFLYAIIAEQNWIELEVGGVVKEILMQDWAMWDTIYVASVPAFIISVIVYVVVSLTTQKIDPPKPFVDVDGNPVESGLFPWSENNKSAA